MAVTFTINTEPFGKTEYGQEARLHTITSSTGMEMKVTNYGCIVTELKTADRDGKFADIVLGYDSLAEYIKDTPYFGAIVGRYGNRIAKGKFTLDGKEYTLAVNNGENALHGGIKGFDKVVWQDVMFKKADGAGLVLTYTSVDGEEGYPGNLTVKVIYTLTANDEFRIDYEITTDAPTVQNITNHSYFNLAGHGEGDILSHEMMLNADGFIPIDEGLIPLGEIRNVAGTPMDFTKPTAIGARIEQDDEQLKYGAGYDHNFVLNGDDSLKLAARVYEPTSGRVMEVLTTEPGIQFYSGNFLDGSNVGKGGKVYNHRYGFCLETQHFPDSPNQPQFPSVVLRPGQVYTSTTVHRFSAK